MKNVTISPTLQSDAPAIEVLLKQANLPSQDFADHLDHFFTARDGERIIGAVGLENHNHTGLFRSLVVDPAFRGQELGQRLAATLIEYARSSGLEELFLLTTTAADFFPRFGFEPTQREAAPSEIQATKEFSSICPSTAVCMVLRLKTEDQQ